MYKDMRFDLDTIKSFIGKKFIKYRHDQFDVTNTVTQRVGLFIEEITFNLINEQQFVNYFGSNEDISIFRIEETSIENIKSAFVDVDQIDTSVDGIITEIKLVNENQKVFSQDGQYDIWLTRAIIFVVDGREITFEKDVVPFSEEICIYKGYSTEQYLSSESEFLEGWDSNVEAQCFRETICIK